MPTLDRYRIASGKVRDIYDMGDDTLLLVASDRISAFDVVLPTPIPDKGRVLTGMTRFWLGATRHLTANHMLGVDASDLPAAARTIELRGRSMLCRRLAMLPVECAVRGYLAGSGLRDYRTSGGICGHPLPAGLLEASRLPAPLFTPATKAQLGSHDQNITLRQAASLIGTERLAQVERVSIALYQSAASHAAARGIILADTKFEFGLDRDERLVLADEVLTPDSSRFWPVEGYQPGSSPRSFDKQYVRDYLETLDWDKTDPGPELPDPVRDATRSRYVEAYERLVGTEFSAYLTEMGVA